jgi:hypothetical protein
MAVRVGLHQRLLPPGNAGACPRAQVRRDSRDKGSTDQANGPHGLPQAALQAPGRSHPDQRPQDDAQIGGGNVRLDLLRDLASSSHEDAGKPTRALQMSEASFRILRSQFLELLASVVTICQSCYRAKVKTKLRRNRS